MIIKSIILIKYFIGNAQKGSHRFTMHAKQPLIPALLFFWSLVVNYARVKMMEGVHLWK